VILQRVTDAGLSLAHDIAEISAHLMNAMSKDGALDVLEGNLKRICPFNDFIVFLYRPHTKPLVLTTNLGMEWITNRLSDYNEGLYLLDPFYQKAAVNESGFFRLIDISPEEYFESEYYNHFYKHTNIIDETRFIVSVDDGTSMQVLAARTDLSPKFQDLEIASLGIMQPLLEEYCRAHFARAERKYPESPPGADQFDLRDKIAGMPGAQLTSREIDTIELMLKGHSTKSLARVLNIDDGTVSNHKRNVYQKLNIHSQAQLFSLFLQSLADG
jgi:DNA-binding CsgD family transcriptional regulator